jgi:peptidyl-prolyl cis-trans isomerase SurA
MKNLMRLLLITAVTLNAFAQNSSKTLLTIANEEVRVEEFLSVYNKNRQIGEALDPKTIDEYLDLFVNFKLKVKEAESLRMDQEPAFISELAGYRKQLAKPYLVDTEIGERLIEEAYLRLQTEVRASHILISLSENASPEDTLKAFLKIQKLRYEINAGADFASYASAYSQDPSAKANGGDLGYFSALYMVYPFENAAFTTTKGGVSKIIRTRFGYHILKVTDTRSSRGEVKVAHIMIKNNKNTDSETGSDTSLAKNKIEAIYKKLVEENANFEEMAKQYSDDKKSASNGGELPWFGSNKMVESFENTAFGLSQKNALSKPVQSPYGWHIIKLIDRKGLGSFEEEKLALKIRVEKDSRSQLKRSSLVNQLKEEYDYQENELAIAALYSHLQLEPLSGRITLKNSLKSSSMVLFTLAEKPYKLSDFVDYLLVSERTATKVNDVQFVVNDAYSKWSEEQIIVYENANLERKYDDFRLLMKEYRDGILLYELTDERVWSKAIKDTTGLKTYFQSNKHNYMWPPRVKAKVINCLNDKVAKKVAKQLKKKVVNFEELQAKINKRSSLNMVVEDGLYAKGDDDFVDQVAWVQGVSKPIKDNQNVKLVYVEDLLPKQAKLLNDVRGLVISDFQESLQNQWVDELKSKYTVVVNTKVLGLLKDNRLHELEDSVEAQEIPKYTGRFGVAFRSAINDLGSSKSIMFQWNNKSYTTELK